MEEKKKRKNWRDFDFDLFGTTWKVHFVDFIPLSDKDDDSTVHFGFCNTYTDTITVALGAPDGAKFDDDKIFLTLLHEIKHAICNTGQYNHISDDEPFVEWMARCMYSLIQQNVFKYAK